MRWASAVGWALVLCVGAGTAEKAMSQSVPTVLGSTSRPTFGTRPVGLGFRPEASGGRAGLMHSGGLQDAMNAARANPLEPLPVVVQPPDPELTQAVQALRSQQQVRTQQLAAQTAARRRAPASMPYVVRTNLPAALRPPASDMEDRLRGYLENLGRSGDAMAVRRQGRAYVLQGTVGSEDERRIIEQLIRLEPGVYEVDNQLKVASPGAKLRP